jgi:predicted LPLAT superfamily acyltransferase
VTQPQEPGAFRACALVPCLDGGRSIGPVVRGARAFVDTVFVVDDGSTDDTAGAAEAAGAVVMRHGANRGKGAALRSGLWAARAHGFTHAVTLDGDGQHDPAEIPSLLDRARAEPTTLVVGVRRFPDRGVPRSSRFGRWWSNLWVRIETGLQLGDTQSGYRVYPIAATLALGLPPSRFEWEVEVIVRTCWSGRPIAEVPVAVAYPDERTSHYRGCRDSARISWLHARLVCAAALRCLHLGRRRPAAPGLDARAADGASWTGRSHGTALGYSIFLWAMRLGGRRAAYALLWAVVPYYVLFAGAARRASAAYLARVLGPRPWWRRPLDVARHFAALGTSIIDAVLVSSGRAGDFTFEHENLDVIRDTYARGRGLILLSAHVGSRALAGEFLSDLKLHAVAYDNEVAEIRRFHARARAAAAPTLIVANDGLRASIEIIRALAAGEAVAMLADRARAGHTVRVPFLGDTAEIPAGPFLVAVLSGAPVVLTFGGKEGARHHHFYALPARTLGPVPRERRDEAIREAALWYAGELEAFVRRCPFQWYNFYDFWAPVGRPAERTR